MNSSLKYDLDFTSENAPKKGTLLISNPEMPDKIFNRSVILLCEHNETGTLGFILNKRSMTFLNELIEDFDDIPEKLYYGGPVDMNSLYILHKSDLIKESNFVIDDIKYGGNIDNLSSLYNTSQLTHDDIKFCLGYSSWIPNQLEFEIQRKSWITYDNVDSNLIFLSEPEDMWKNVLNTMGNKYKIYANYPKDASLN